MMKKFFYTAISLLLVWPALVWALSSSNGSVGGSSSSGQSLQDCDAVICNPLTGINSIPDVINRIIDFLALLAAPIAVLMLVWAAYLFVLAGTSPDNVKKAKSIILYVVVGLVVLGLSKAIVYVTCSVLGTSCSG